MEGYKIVEMTKDALEVECDNLAAVEADAENYRVMTEEEVDMDRRAAYLNEISNDILDVLKRYDLTCREAIDILESVKSGISWAAYHGKIGEI